MYKIALLSALVAVAVAGRIRPYDGPYGPKDYYEPKPYDFGYETKDEYGTQQNRHESSDGHGGVKGSYGYVDPWGIYRQVDYVADEHGYRAKVRTNEPGTANQDPADVLVDADPVSGPVAPIRGPKGPLPPLGPVKDY